MTNVNPMGTRNNDWNSMRTPEELVTQLLAGIEGVVSFEEANSLHDALHRAKAIDPIALSLMAAGEPPEQAMRMAIEGRKAMAKEDLAAGGIKIRLDPNLEPNEVRAAYPSMLPVSRLVQKPRLMDDGDEALKKVREQLSLAVAKNEELERELYALKQKPNEWEEAVKMACDEVEVAWTNDEPRGSLDLLIDWHAGDAARAMRVNLQNPLRTDAVGTAKPTIFKPEETASQLRNRLALSAMQYLNKPKFKVWATLDIDKPRTIRAFDTFGELLARAYEMGKQESAK